VTIRSPRAGDREAVVTDGQPFDLHGVTYYDLALILSELAVTGKRHPPYIC
jgi:hypothetical protein